MHGEYNAAVETVTQLAVILTLVTESGLDEVLLCITFGQSGAGQGIGLIGTVSQMKLFKYVITESALAEIGQAYGTSLIGIEQGVLEEIQRKLVGDEHGFTFILQGLL